MYNPTFVTIAIVLGLIHGPVSAQQNLFINELVAENNTGMMDDFFERDDWVEIYNTGPLTNLAGYYLSDDANDLTKWKIPATDPGVTFVTSNSHIVFWIDRDPEQGADHVDFSLNIDGETVILTDPDGTTIIDQISYPQLAPDISWGRSCDGCPEWQYFNHVTFDDDNLEIQPAPELLFINEVQTQNVSTLHDLNQDYDPWLELFNPNSFQVNLAGYYLGTIGNPLQWQIPASDPFRTVVPAGGFLLIWCDNEPGEGTLHSSFQLNSAGNAVVLTAPNGTTVTDTYTYPSVAPDHSYGRQSDGSITSIDFIQPTPRVSNSLVIIQPELLFINELLAANVTDSTDNFDEHEDWFEIFNPNDYSVNLTGYFFTDNPDNTQKWEVPGTFPDSVTLDPGSWMLFWADEDQAQGVRHSSFRLSNNSEYLGFYGPDGFSLVDEIVWNSLGVDTSLGRIPDGGDEWVRFSVTTPDTTNLLGTVGLPEAVQPSFFRMYPNPSGGQVFFSSASSFRIYDSRGRLIEQVRRVNGINIDGWPSGIYFLVDESGRCQKLVRE
jgi:large repetitive protein